MKKQITIEEAIKSIPGFKGFERSQPQGFKEYIPNFYCSNYSDAKRNLICRKQCDNCQNIVTETRKKNSKL